MKEVFIQHVNIYEYTENNNLSILNFEETIEEWLKFVYNNRQSEGLTHKYDIVKGPVANDNLYQVLSGYEDGTYNIEETIRRLKTYLLSNQISFHINVSYSEARKMLYSSKLYNMEKKINDFVVFV